MNKCSGDCVYDYYESDTNYGECRHPDFDIEKPDHCPGYVSKEDAKADAKYKDRGDIWDLDYLMVVRNQSS